MSDYADEIAARLMCDDMPGGPYESLSGEDARLLIAQAAREGYALGYGAAR